MALQIQELEALKAAEGEEYVDVEALDDKNLFEEANGNEEIKSVVEEEDTTMKHEPPDNGKDTESLETPKASKKKRKKTNKEEQQQQRNNKQSSNRKDKRGKRQNPEDNVTDGENDADESNENDASPDGGRNGLTAEEILSFRARFPDYCERRRDLRESLRAKFADLVNNRRDAWVVKRRETALVAEGGRKCFFLPD